ncbi:MAG: MEDS domain-containing protein, partial [Chloroflexota bacterium]|nr:MEDS domain-containing protein [Chloroflexota bacterium]
MEQELRHTGLDIVGDAPWGTHFCQFYQTKQDLIDILVPYFKAGLENNEFCMWVTAEPLSAEDALLSLRQAVPNVDDYLERGQLEVLPHDKWYDIEGVFDMHRVLNGWVGRLESALARGFSGLRLTGNTFWLEKKDWRSFLDYEGMVNDVIGKYRMIAMCTFCLDKCDACEMMDVLSTHQFAVAKREGHWAAIEDIPRKRLAEKLRGSEEQLRRLASFPELNPNPVTEMDLEGHIRYLNPAAKRLFPALEARGIEHPWLAGLLPIARQLAAGGEGPIVREVSVEGECYHQAAVYIEDARRLRLYGMEITGRKQAEEELRKLSRAVEQSPATVVITNLAGTIEYANPRFEETTGYSVAEAIGQNPRILKSGETPPHVYKELWSTIKAGKEWRG